MFGLLIEMVLSYLYFNEVIEWHVTTWWALIPYSLVWLFITLALFIPFIFAGMEIGVEI